MLDINYIQNAFENHFNVTINPNVFNAKQTLVNRFGFECKSFEIESKGLSYDSEYRFLRLLQRFNGMAYLKRAGHNEYTCFRYTKADINNWTYGTDNKKLSRVLSEVLECCDTLHDVGLYNLMKTQNQYGYVTESSYDYYMAEMPREIEYDIKAIGELPRAFTDNPLTMKPAQFIAWLSEQYKKAIKASCQTFHIDFRPLSCLIAGNGKDFGSCYGLECFPYQEGNCYNSSPSACAMSDRTAILYSLAEDGKSLKARAWIYFPDNDSISFGRLYGSIDRSICKRAAELLGFNTVHAESGISVYKIAQGNIYFLDSMSYCIGTTKLIYSSKIVLNCSCMQCGEYISSNTSCLCNECSGKVKYCAHCGHNKVSEENDIYIEGIGYCCEDCVRYCNDCEEYHLQDDMTDVGGSYRYRFVCNSCLSSNYVLCDHCDNWVSSDEYTYMDNLDRSICDRCLDEYTQCEACNDWVYSHETSTCNICGGVLCDDCSHKCKHCNDTVCRSCMTGDVCDTCYNEIEEDIDDEEIAIHI